MREHAACTGGVITDLDAALRRNKRDKAPPAPRGLERLTALGAGAWRSIQLRIAPGTAAGAVSRSRCTV